MTKEEADRFVTETLAMAAELEADQARLADGIAQLRKEVADAGERIQRVSDEWQEIAGAIGCPFTPVKARLP